MNFYKSLIKYRNDSDVLKYGSFKRLPSNKNVAKYIREYEGHRLLIIVNLSNHKIIDKENCDRSVILSNYRQDFLKIIPPYFAALYLIP